MALVPVHNSWWMKWSWASFHRLNRQSWRSGWNDRKLLIWQWVLKYSQLHEHTSTDGYFGSSESLEAVQQIILFERLICLIVPVKFKITKNDGFLCGFHLNLYNLIPKSSHIKQVTWRPVPDSVAATILCEPWKVDGCEVKSFQCSVVKWSGCFQSWLLLVYSAKMFEVEQSIQVAVCRLLSEDPGKKLFTLSP